METMTSNKTYTKETLEKKLKLQECQDIEDIAMISVDNTQTFENKELNELYVNEGEQAAHGTKKIMEACKYYGITMINVLEEHPIGHISLASNYKNKKPFEMINYFEVADRTDEENGLSERAQFTVEELKSFLKELSLEGKSQMLWPDHGVKGTQGVELSEPLNESDFDLKVIKGTNAAREAYSGFDETVLDEELKKMGKKILIVGGVATDYCVGQTALDGQEKGYQVYLVNEAIRGVAQETTDAMIEILKAKEVEFISAMELFNIIEKKFA
ncbi:isochorismatase family protein [Candidatus Gracilibacteria bacterium]|nr:isochorismatase family protein [Candidatus Gracilibacteria bacterium]